MFSGDDDDNEDVLNSSMNSTTSKHRKVSPNKISPRVSVENVPEEGKSFKQTVCIQPKRRSHFLKLCGCELHRFESNAEGWKA